MSARRLLPHPLLTPILAAVWLLLNNSLAPGHVVLGLLLGWLIPLFTLRFWPETVRIRKPRVLIRFLAVFISAEISQWVRVKLSVTGVQQHNGIVGNFAVLVLPLG